MKVIDLLNKIANGEIEEGFRVKRQSGIYEYREGKNHFVNIEDEMYVYSLGDLTKLNDEIEIIEEKPKKIEEINKSYPIFNFDEKSFDAMKDMLQDVYSKQVEVIKAVNYLLEKESDK